MSAYMWRYGHMSTCGHLCVTERRENERESTITHEGTLRDIFCKLRNKNRKRSVEKILKRNNERERERERKEKVNLQSQGVHLYLSFSVPVFNKQK